MLQIHLWELWKICPKYQSHKSANLFGQSTFLRFNEFLNISFRKNLSIKIPSNFVFTALLNITSDGKLKVVTAIIKLKTTPSNASFPKSALLIGIQPKISAYIGTPQIVAIITPKGFLFPKAVIILGLGD